MLSYGPVEEIFFDLIGVYLSPVELWRNNLLPDARLQVFQGEASKLMLIVEVVRLDDFASEVNHQFLAVHVLEVIAVNLRWDLVNIPTESISH